MKLFNLFFLLNCLVLLSCTELVTNDLQTEELLPRTSFSSVAPTKVSGILSFSSFSHAIAYHEFLEEEISGSNNQDSVLGYYESLLDFTSLRASQYVDEIETRDTIAHLSNAFNGSPMLLSILNANHEVKIGSDVYVYYARNQTYKIIGGDNISLVGFRNIPKNQDSIPYIAITNKVFASPGDRVLIDRTDDTISFRTDGELEAIIDHPDDCLPWN